MSNNQLNDLSKTYLEAVYGGAKKEEPKDTRMVLTHADKKANTPAWQNRDKKNPKTGKSVYKRADHLKDDYEFARHKASIISRGGRLEDAVESWNQKLAYREAMKDVSEKKEVNVKDTYKTVAAIVDYDRSKKGSEDATWDSEHGKKKAAKKEKDYAAWERSKMKKDDPNWKHKKYHTGMHGEDKDWGYDSKGNSLNPVDIEKKKRNKDDLAGAPKVKKESLSDWRTDLSSLIEIVAEPEEEAEKKVKEGKVNNKVVINPKISEAIEEIGGEVLEHHEKDKDGNTIPHENSPLIDNVEEGYGSKSSKAPKGSKVGSQGGAGLAKKEIKALSTAARTLKGRNVAKADKIEESYDEIDNDLLQFIESSLGNLPEDQILDLVESGWHRRNPGKKHPLESGSSKVKRRPVSDAEKKSTDKSDRMYVAMRRVKDRQKGYDRDKADAADRLHSTYTDRQSKRKAGASSKEAAAQSHGEFGGKGFNIKRGGRGSKGSHAPETDRGKGSKAKKRAAALTKEENFFSRFRNI